MTLSPKVSVLMPVYNAERYLHEAVDSVLSQSFSNFEFIIVEDGSTDETPTILDGYDDPRIMRLNNEHNLGLTKSLNLGLKRARGEFIARMDADDRSLPSRLEQQVAFLDPRLLCGLVGCNATEIDESGTYLGQLSSPDSNQQLQIALLRNNPVVHGSVMFRRLAVTEIGGYREFCEDYDLWLRMGERWDLACLPTTLYEWRRHPASISEKFKSSQSAGQRRAHTEALHRRGRLAAPGIIPRRSSWRKVMGQRGTQRLRWWALGCLEAGYRKAALRFAVTALVYDPLNTESRKLAWLFATRFARMVRRIVSHKIGRITGVVATAKKRNATKRTGP